MIRKETSFLILVFVFVSCATNTGPGTEPIPNMVPDDTPYIAGLIEASPDTTHHYPEIVVGYFTDIYSDQDEPYIPGLVYENPGIYTPTLLRQLRQTSILFGLQFEPEPDALVTVRGPMGLSEEQEVTFSHEKNGVYGDQELDLSRVAKGKYQLRVELPDGRSYGLTTTIPETTDIPVPDSISVPVVYEPFDDGTPKEEDTRRYKIKFNQSEESEFTITQFNSDKDRDLLLLEPDEAFQYTDRSNFLRTGIGYSGRLSNASPETFTRGWVQSLDKPLNEVWMSKHWWFRFSFFDDKIGNMFFPLKDKFTSSNAWSEKFFRPSANAAFQNDSTFLFEVSTIHKMGPAGELLPKDSSDAIGFFSGYYSRYKQTTLYPIRDFDLDTVLTEN